MNILIAGATGTLGLPLTRALVARGHTVAGLTRSPEKQPLLEQLGARALVADALDAPGLERAIREAAPTHVVHLLTALPKNGPMRAADIAATNDLRIRGTANLLQAAIAAGARRIVGESFVHVYGYGDLGAQPRAEDDLPPVRERDTGLRAVVEALRSLEQQLLSAAAQGRIEAVVLRYGLFYGSESPSTRHMLKTLRKRRLPLPRGAGGIASLIHVADAVDATIAALERGQSGAIYNIVDDQPVGFDQFIRAAAQAIGAPRPLALPRWLLRLAAPTALTVLTTRLPLANEKAKRELGWRPRFPSYHDGLRQVAREPGADGAALPAARSAR